MTELELLVALGALVAAVCFVVLWRAKQSTEHGVARRREDAWKPSCLRDAKLILAEPPPMRAEIPAPLTARVDRAYRQRSGSVVLVELKTRGHHGVFPSDVIELSVQRVVLEANGYAPVESTAFVVTESRLDGSRQTHAVDLLSADRIAVLAKRYDELRTRRAVPERANELAKCRSCPYASACAPQVLRGEANFSRPAAALSRTYFPRTPIRSP